MAQQNGRGNEKRFLWSSVATKTLIELWQDNIDGFRGARKNSHIYKEMAEKMKEFGPSHAEIKNKLENLQKKYRAECAKVGPSGGTSSTWEYFENVVSVLSMSGTVGYHPIADSTDFSRLLDGEPSSSNDTENSMTEPSCSRPKRRRVDPYCEEIVDIERQKLSEIKQLVKDSANFQKEALSLLRARHANNI